MVLALGMMERLKHRYGKVALFRPLNLPGGYDGDIETLRKYFRIEQSPDEIRGLDVEYAEKILAESGIESLVEEVLMSFERLRDRYDFILCMGIRAEELNRLAGTDLNIELAKNLSAPVAGIFSMKGEKAEAFDEIVTLWAQSIRQQGAEIFMICANHCGENMCERHLSGNRKISGGFPVYTLPAVAELERLTLADLMQNLPLEWLAGGEKQKENNIHSFRIGTMGLSTLLKDLKPYEFVITASERVDLASGLLLSAQSSTTPMNGGILLCGPDPDPSFLNLLDGLEEIAVPVLYTKKYENELLSEAVGIRPSIRISTPRKIATALNIFAEHVDRKRIDERLASMQSGIMTPAMFRLRLFERAGSDRRTVILPESGDDRILAAADILLRRKVVDIMLVGVPDAISRRCKALGIDLSGASILDVTDGKAREHYASLYHSLRKHRGVTMEMARDHLADTILMATLALHEGKGDALVAGAAHSTRDTVSPALKIIRTKEEYPIASSCFFMCFPTRVLAYADCALNPDPTAEELAVIAMQTADTAAGFGIEARIAMLSYSTGDSGSGADVDKVRKATELLRSRRPDLPVTGPIQYDAAVDPEVAGIKMPDDPVAGRATVFIFPDLDTGNIAYKAVQRSAGAVAVGPVMQGLRKPVNDLSRGCSVDDIIDTVAISAIQAQENGK
jgi:phosphate acetyltransferase